MPDIIRDPRFFTLTNKKKASRCVPEISKLQVQVMQENQNFRSKRHEMETPSKFITTESYTRFNPNPQLFGCRKIFQFSREWQQNTGYHTAKLNCTSRSRSKLIKYSPLFSFIFLPNEQTYWSIMSTCWTACDGLDRLLRDPCSSSKGSSTISSFTGTLFPLDDVVSGSAGRFPDFINCTIDFSPTKNSSEKSVSKIKRFFPRKFKRKQILQIKINCPLFSFLFFFWDRENIGRTMLWKP